MAEQACRRALRVRRSRSERGLDEPERHNAIHGLVRWLPWALLGQAQNVVTLGLVLHPQPGYPWRISFTIEYRLGREGLTVTTEVADNSGVAAPFGLGFHPYITVGTDTIDSARLRVPALRQLVTDERGSSDGTADVAGTEFDFTTMRAYRIHEAGHRFLRVATGSGRHDPCRRAGSRGEQRSDRLGGRRVQLPDGLHRRCVGDPKRRRTSVAIEPMTCPPDALRSGTGIVRLSPGEFLARELGDIPFLTCCDEMTFCARFVCHSWRKLQESGMFAKKPAPYIAFGT